MISANGRGSKRKALVSATEVSEIRSLCSCLYIYSWGVCVDMKPRRRDRNAKELFTKGKNMKIYKFFFLITLIAFFKRKLKIKIFIILFIYLKALFLKRISNNKIVKILNKMRIINQNGTKKLNNENEVS